MSYAVAQAAYYVGWLVMFLVESIAWTALGLVVGLVAFVAGGFAWAVAQAAHTEPGARLHGPILRASQRMVDAGGPWILGAVIVGGPPAVAASAAAARRGDVARLALWSSFAYSAVFAVFHLVRPDAGVPMELTPIGLR